MSWRFTSFYGDPDPNKRDQSWQLMDRLSDSGNTPWILGGDFNEILNDNEKEGGAQKARKGMDNFREALDKCRLIDPGFSGAKHT